MGMPTVRGIHHTGINVPDMDEAVRFFVDALGCTKLAELAPIRGEGDWMRQHLGVHPDAEVTAITMLGCSDGSRIELLRYSSPDQQTEPPRNADVGSAHLAFEVDDVVAAVNHLHANGAEVMGEPKQVTEGPTAGVAWIYVRTSWGLQLELISRPSS